MPASYPRQYYVVRYDALGTIPKTAGNVIATYDTDGFYYDIGDPNDPSSEVIRRKANCVEFISSLSEAREEPTTIFIVRTGTSLDESGNSYNTYSGYCWDVNAGYYEVFTNYHDTEVRSITNNSKQIYLLGVESNSTGVSQTYKNSNVWINSSGNKIHADIDGKADFAGSADSAGTAELANKANYDNANTPQLITSYLHDVSSDAVDDLDNTLTFTLGDGTVKSVRVSNTKYPIFNNSNAGIVNNTGTTVDDDTTGLILSGSGWILGSNITIGTATKAIGDDLGQTIKSTYYKSITLSGHTLTLKKGDNSTSTITIPDTTYNVFTTSANGLAPKASGSGDTSRFLRGDATWADIPTYQGATSGASGVAGLVPAAESGKQNYYLKGDGTWGTVFAVGSDGLVPAPTLADAGKSLKVKNDGTGVWEACVDTKNTAGSLQASSAQKAAPLYVIGAANQSSYDTTCSDSLVYIQGDKLYQSNGAGTPLAVQVVDVSSTQALTNKTYEGYTLGGACERAIANTISPTITAQDTFTGDGSTTEFTFTNTAVEITEVLVNDVIVTLYVLDNVNNKIIFTSAPANGADIEVSYLATNANYVGGAIPTADLVSNALSDIDAEIAEGLSQKTDTSVIANTYNDTSVSYSVGDYVMYDIGTGVKLYRCKASIAVPAGAFDTTKWDEIILADSTGVWMAGTLAANATTCTISNANIKTTSTFEFYTDKFGVAPINVSVSTGTLVLTFVAQSTGTNVKVRVYN